MKIGFIGLGIMGRPMALNLIKGGYTVTVWARRAESMQPLLEAGAIAAASPAEAARGNSLVISMVADAPDVREVMLGEQGVVRAAAPGLVAVDMSTIAPAAARSIGADLAKAREVASKLRAGQVSINGGGGDLMAPFGGYKMSGNGREWGDYAFHEFLETKAVLGYAPKEAAE